MRASVSFILALLMIFALFTVPAEAQEDSAFRELDSLLHDGIVRFSTHEHQWVDGKCTICKQECTHPDHDPDGICIICGMPTFHRYHFGVCELCGAPLVFQYDLLPEEYYFEECEHQGTLESVKLEGRLSDVSPTIAKKSFEVYLPYGYNPRKKYDVMFLQGGLGSPYNACTSQGWWLTEDYDKQFCFKTIWDHMIENGDCEPMIIVSVDGYSEKHGATRYRDLYEETAYFVRYQIYPYVIKHYSTYAKSANPEDIQAARAHFGYGGFSNGGYMAYWGCMNMLLDYCGNLMPIAGSWRSEMVLPNIYNYQTEYPIIRFISGAGTQDGYAYDQTIDDYITIVANVDYLTDGLNAWFIESDYGHDWCAGSIIFYNGLRLMFTSE